MLVQELLRTHNLHLDRKVLIEIKPITNWHLLKTIGCILLFIFILNALQVSQSSCSNIIYVNLKNGCLSHNIWRSVMYATKDKKFTQVSSCSQREESVLTASFLHFWTNFVSFPSFLNIPSVKFWNLFLFLRCNAASKCKDVSLLNSNKTHWVALLWKSGLSDKFPLITIYVVSLNWIEISLIAESTDSINVTTDWTDAESLSRLDHVSFFCYLESS